MLYIILIILAILAIIEMLLLIGLQLYGYILHKSDKPQTSNLKVAVIVPCKGLLPNIENNLKAVCEQDYPNYSVIYVLDSKKDPVYPIIEKIEKTYDNAKIGISKKSDRTSGKISALISGIKESGDVDVYVFADSDVKPHEKWLSYLVTYLSEENIAATTGYRWYFPVDLKSTLMSTWMMASVTTLFHPLTNFAWGGSTCIKKTIFDKLKIESKWKAGYSDDLVLTETIKKAGYKIRFVPRCIAESSSETDFKKFLKWGTHQLTWIRWYYPVMWLRPFFGFIMLQILKYLGFILLILGFTIPGIIMISTIFLEMIYGLVGFLVFRKLMYYPKERFGNVILYIFLMPIAFILYAYNFLHSSIVKEIKWGGRYYRKSDLKKYEISYTKML